jgi:WhiB family redox-sensing transcriptional regulator
MSALRSSVGDAVPAVVQKLGHRTLVTAEWRLLARCKGESADTFYPPDKERPSARRRRELHAKQICLGCPVLEPCRRYALETAEPHGVWGGTTPRDRAKARNGVDVPAEVTA